MNTIQHRPRTSQPGGGYFRDLQNKNAPGDSSHPLGSGIGAGNVNAMMERKYSYLDNRDVQNEIYSKLNEQNNLN